MEKELISLIKKLVAFKTVSENYAEKKAALEMVNAWFLKKGFKTRLFPHANNPSLLVKVPGDIKKKVLLVAHLDVVAAPDKSFCVKIKNRRLIGRGVLDNKGCLAMLMLFLEKIKNKKNYPNFELMINTDEEIGGADGACRLTKSGLFNDVGAIFIPDGGSDKQVVVKEKGIIHLLLSVKGHSAHGAYPWLGSNAVINAYSLYKEIEKLFIFDRLKIKNHWHPTVNLGRLWGGQSINQVPAEAELGLDIRFTEQYEFTDLLKKIKKIISNKANILKIHHGELLNGDEKHQLIRQYVKIMSAETGKKIKLIPEHGASDARHFSLLKVPTWLQYPEGGNIHQDDEWLSIDSAIKMINGLENFFGKLIDKDFEK